MTSRPIESVACGTCTACCRDQLVLLTENDDPALYETRATTNPVNGAPALALLLKPDGACQYLGEAGCTIYDRRPEMCRVFSCTGFVARLLEATTRAERRRIYGKALATDPVWNAGRARLPAARDLNRTTFAQARAAGPGGVEGSRRG